MSRHGRSRRRRIQAADRGTKGGAVHYFTRRVRLSRWKGLALAATVAAAAIVVAGTAGAASGKTGRATSSIVFMSTQLTPVDEQQSFLNVVLKGFPGSVSFVPATSVPQMTQRVQAEAQAGHGSLDLAGATVGDLETVAPQLMDLSDVAAKLKSAGIPASLMNQAKLGTQKQLSIPWMQATYLMAANKKALPYLPKGANIKALTWGQFDQWAKNLQQHFGQPEVGFPAGPSGLFPRFLEGYLLPSFTGRLVTRFESPSATAAWLYLKNLWRYVNPQSLTYNFMQDPLLSGEVMVGWDHVARLTGALQQQASNFVVFPAPAGPKGRGFLPVLATVGIPKTAPDAAGAKQLILYLDKLSQQAKTISTEGFFPVVSGKLSEKLGPGLLKIAGAVKTQQTSKDAVPSVLPIGLGGQAGAYAKVFTDTFTRLVLNKEGNPQGVLKSEGDTLQALLNAAGAHCWQPDPASSGVCQVG
jgi:multiple sugar transport system substrate-binding protein